eukprot:m.101925 g.101925  ORF g.101925 m.101925 type:complete len:67 (+) comp37148_c0_seq30:1897-2097(+)
MRTIADIMPMIGARFYTQIENSLNQSDLIEAELLKVDHVHLLLQVGSGFFCCCLGNGKRKAFSSLN